VVTREDFIALTVRVNAVVYLQLARECLLLNNFNSTMEILSGLNNSSIVRLKKLWEVRPSGLLSLSLSLFSLPFSLARAHLQPSNTLDEFRLCRNDSTYSSGPSRR
jgi:hypothetical protein